MLLTDKINDIDISIEFCKLNNVHGSIIIIQELQQLYFQTNLI